MEQPLREVLQDPEVVRGLTENPAFFRFPRRPVVAVGAVAWPPHVVMTSVAGGRIVVSGAMGNVLQVLAQTLNFTYNIVIPEDGGWGSRRPNGSWTGMVGQLVRKEADLALGPFGVTVSRAEVIDYTLSFLMGDYTLLSRKGPPEIDPWGFLFPLTETVWAAVAAALVVAWLAATLVARRPRYVNVLGWAGGVFLQHVRVFFNQGITWKAAYGLAGQTVLGSWMVMAAVVFWSYTGNLTSLLAVRHIPQPIQTLRDLLDDPGVTLYISANTLIIDTISRMEDGELREMYDLRNVGRLKYHSLFPVSKMRYGRESSLYTTLTHDMDIASYFQKTKRCDFYKSRGLFTTNSHCMITQKKSPLMKAINYRARSVVEAGLYDHWMQQEMPATNCRYAPSVITVQEPLSLSNLWGLFVMLFVMLMVAVAVFCLELCLPPKTKTGP
ncbi:probable glutamate receptor [Scylla paramamosain]|uniref:probable glutamate receptor n=1 Tax=Scylla paramamosain TaxID=85552 RepID=UPI0030830822